MTNARNIILVIWGLGVAPTIILVLAAIVFLAARNAPASAQSAYLVMQEFGVTLLLISRALSWPVVALLIFWLLSSAKVSANLSGLLSRFRSVKLFGSEITFTEEGAKTLYASAEEAFRAYREKANAEISRLARAEHLPDLLKQIFNGLDSPREVRDCKNVADFRCTIHIQDVLFEDTLYQLLDYFPRPTSASGRRFSIRFGIIGRAWRLAAHQGGGNESESKVELIKLWGMTDDEASSPSKRKPSYLCILIRRPQSQLPLAIMYMDSTAQNAFGASESEWNVLAAKVAAECGRIQLTQGLERVVNAIEKYGTRIGVHG